MEFNKAKNDPNYDEYRELVDQIIPPFTSIGAMVHAENLLLSQNGDFYEVVPSTLYPLLTLNEFMGKLALQGRSGTLPNIQKGYKFSDCLTLVRSTCAYIGENLIITAGHNVFYQNTSQIKNGFETRKIIFGLSDAEIKKGRIPASKVFDIQRVLFGQDVDFSAENRADWALIKLQQRPQQAFPAPLIVKSLSQGDDIADVWLAGYPWGIGLTVCRPPKRDGYCRTKGTNNVTHNLLTAPANSGGPIFDQGNKIIAIVATGKGDNITSRGFGYLGGDTLIPFTQPGQVFTGTQCGVFSSLIQNQGKIFLACELPTVTIEQGTPETITINILLGDGPDQASWTSCNLITDYNVPNDNKLQLVCDYAALKQRSANFRPFNIRGLNFCLNYTPAQSAAPGGGTKKQNMKMMKVEGQSGHLVFGCFGADTGLSLHNYTVLFSNTGPFLAPGNNITVRTPIFLNQGWNTVDENQKISIFDTTKVFMADRDPDPDARRSATGFLPRFDDPGKGGQGGGSGNKIP